jgi:hypothetical protein
VHMYSGGHRGVWKSWDFLKREIDLEGINSLRKFCREKVKITLFLFSRTRRNFSDMPGKAPGAKNWLSRNNSKEG